MSVTRGRIVLFFTILFAFMVYCTYNFSLYITSCHKTTLANRKKDIYAIFLGRFGNVIFEVAGMYSMTLAANCNNTFFKDNNQAERLMKFFPKLKDSLNVVGELPPCLIKVKDLAPNRYHKKTTDDVAAAPGDVFLHGYLGVPTYWYPQHDKEIRELLAVSEELQTQARNYLMELCNGHDDLISQINYLRQGISRNPTDGVTPLVGIQIRRGDKTDRLDGWLLPGKSYFEHAMDYARKKFGKVYFIVVSENKNWAKENVIGNDIIHSNSTDDLLELALLTLCDHTIMSVGTFSWWAAYLAGGEVIYYPNHTKANTAPASYYNDTQYFLPHWKPIL